jgi:hypothetical protein
MRHIQDRAADGKGTPCGAQKAKVTHSQMLSRSATSTTVGRASSMRRLRRRAIHSTTATRPYCRTNGCASFLEIDPATGVASCPICGYTRPLH